MILIHRELAESLEDIVNQDNNLAPIDLECLGMAIEALLSEMLTVFHPTVKEGQTFPDTTTATPEAILLAMRESVEINRAAKERAGEGFEADVKESVDASFKDACAIFRRCVIMHVNTIH